MNKYVMLLEIGKKQQYIFRSNKLAENIGASIIIRHATEEDAKKYYKKYNPTIIYEGGGNALYVFSTKQDGISFAKEYSLDLMKRYPGITLYLVGYELKENQTVKEGILQCYRLLANKKNNRMNAVSAIDYGKTVRCTATNMPATDSEKLFVGKTKYLPKERAENPMSGESIVKYYNSSQQEDIFKDLLPKDYQFPKEVDKLGRSKGNSSYIAVVHIDGNRMGEKIRKFNEEYGKQPTENIEQFDSRYIKALGEFSASIRKQYETSVKEMIQILADNLSNNTNGLRETLDLQDKVLPIRPLILAGDDICFIADGRIGIELARICIEKIQEKEVNGLPLNACGGVAIVKAHYPFSRAYELAEELCQNAKNQIKENGLDASYLDWHVDQAELNESLSAIRKSYIADDKSELCMRPYLVGKTQIGHQMVPNSMDNFYNSFRILARKDVISGEKIARSKIKGLREVLRKGKAATNYYLHSAKNGDLYEIFRRTDNLNGEASFTTYNGKQYSLYFDAIEVMDLLIKLEG